MERAKKGCHYFWIDYRGEFSIYADTDWRQELSTTRLEKGNYFLSIDEANKVVKKLRAVLKGADVIEMPSEEEITIKADSIFYGYPHPYEDEEGDALLDGTMACDAMVQMAEWLKSKCIR